MQIMILNESPVKAFSCSQCSKFFATRSNLKRHMENPNIHNIPYVRSRDQKRWKGHAKKVVSRAETTERMRRWRAENREKNRQNDLRCRVYRLARQKFGDKDSPTKQAFILSEIMRRLGRRAVSPEQPVLPLSQPATVAPLPRKVALPPIDTLPRPPLLTPTLSPPMWSQRRSSNSSISSLSSLSSVNTIVLPPVDTFLSYKLPTKESVKYVESTRILDEFVGVVLSYANA